MGCSKYATFLVFAHLVLKGVNPVRLRERHRAIRHPEVTLRTRSRVKPSRELSTSLFITLKGQHTQM
ncbi:hypothetical protein RRG08_004252 [Elysia crispata]|uniref:Uncharacterized protein n=1 Tax=Elysia crispata TaxID=231223 RepID=A0AAE0YT86_9GAST|nr:hypothetical protein RRG08_004252 [Elysia crispata]